MNSKFGFWTAEKLPRLNDRKSPNISQYEVTYDRFNPGALTQSKNKILSLLGYTHDQYLEVVGRKSSLKKIITYCRVSSASQKKDLLSQKKAIEAFCSAAGKAIDEKFEDIGSELNYKRKSFLKLLEMVERGELSEIVIAHKDRLVRFGLEWFEKFCNDHGVKIIAMNAEALSPEEEMTKDLLSIIHCFSSRLYGLRKYKKKILEMAKEDENS